MEPQRDLTDRPMTAPQVLEEIFLNDGCTLEVSENEIYPTSFSRYSEAYAVAMFVGDDLRIPNYYAVDDEIIHQIIIGFKNHITKVQESMKPRTNIYFGGWIDDANDKNDLVFDVVEVVYDLGWAIEKAIERGQDAIFDLINFVEIKDKDIITTKYISWSNVLNGGDE